MAGSKKRGSARGKAAKAKKPDKQQLNCFVVIGFGNKTDYSTGRVLNLDKTYEKLIRPAFDKVGVNCFRAIDANLTGSIDSIMYRWIYEADIVVADLSTLNANVLYELGVRHAQKPNTTIVIAESELMQRIPFDLGSFVIHAYEHVGEDISEAEQERFVDHLAGVLEKIIALEERRRQAEPHAPPETDSPVFKFLTDMTPPAYTAQSYLEPPPYVPPEQRDRDKAAKEGASLASVIDAAEAAKTEQRFADAIRLFRQAIELQTGGRTDRRPDQFLAQRLALVTYKEGEQPDAEGNIDKETAIAALHEAEDIVTRYCSPKISNDPETLGLSGAINKRLFEFTDDLEYLDRAIAFYERGFYVKQDYYNGINVAYMYTQRANLLPDRFDAIVSYGHANMIRKKVVDICTELMDNEESFAKRGDREWIYMTLAEAYQGMGQTADEARLASRIESEATDFARESYENQKKKLGEAMEEFRRRVRPQELGEGAPAAKSVADVNDASAAAAAGAPATLTPRAGVSAHPIVIDADIVPGKTIKSVEVNYKIEYL